MSKRCHLIPISILLFALILGCAGRSVKRAPIDSIPEDAAAETKIAMLEEMLVAYPEDAYVRYEMGNLYYDQLLPAEAAGSYKKALEIDPSMNKARVNLAMVLAETDEVDSAKVLLNEAIGIDPNDVKAYNNLGMIYYSELDVNSAVKYFSKALEVDPGNTEARYNLGLAFAEQGLLLEAIREWRLILDMAEETGEESETVQRARLSVERTERDMKP